MKRVGVSLQSTMRPRNKFNHLRGNELISVEINIIYENGIDFQFD